VGSVPTALARLCTCVPSCRQVQGSLLLLQLPEPWDQFWGAVTTCIHLTLSLVSVSPKTFSSYEKFKLCRLKR
jgi:hypothetical protein